MARAQRNINKNTAVGSIKNRVYGQGSAEPVPVDNSIPDINQTGVRAKYIVSQANKTIRVPSIRRITAGNPPDDA
jgi:hypothetical protein